MKNLNLDETVKSSEYTGSNEPFNSDSDSGNTFIPQVITEEQVLDEKDKIVQLSNDSILQGYDLAIEILTSHGNTEGVKTLTESRSAIEGALHEVKAERILGNFGNDEDKENI